MDHYVIPADATVDIPQSTNKLEQLFELELKKKQKQNKSFGKDKKLLRSSPSRLMSHRVMSAAYK